MKSRLFLGALALYCGVAWAAEDPPSSGGFRLRSEASTFAGPTADKPAGQAGVTGFPKPYSPPCTERENVFAFTEKPAVKNLGNDKYEITFAVKGNCDVTVGIVDSGGVVVRHLGSGVLGANAPAPFQKNSLKQTIYWNGKDDLYAYHKTPDKLKARVMLGLKPEFDKRLGGTSGKNLPGKVYGIAPCEAGVFVMTMGSSGRYYIRKFDHDGNYLMSLVPPPANLPEEKLAGMGYVEYEPGQRALHCPVNLNETASNYGGFLAAQLIFPMAEFCRPVVVGDRLFYAAKGAAPGSQLTGWDLRYVYGDGSTSLNGCLARTLFSAGNFLWAPGSAPSLALVVSPDGRQLYFVGYGHLSAPYSVWRCELDGDKPATLFLGGKEPSSAEGKFSGTTGLDCDAQGRLYVCDEGNSRVQVFSPEGKFLKSIAVDRPQNIAVHRKTGAMYLQHTASVEGRSRNRIAKYRSFDEPTPVAFVDVPLGLLALDSWTPKPRLWLSGPSIWEDDGNAFKKIVDFAEEAKKEDGANHVGWDGGIGDKVTCDPLREQVYFRKSIRFDLKTGALLGNTRLPGVIDDIAFDKRGYLHCHFNPGFFQAGVGRLDPGQSRMYVDGLGRKYPDTVTYSECPYDYGVEGKSGWIGILPVKDQEGAKFFQDGIGVNMMGDIAEQCNIYFTPKMSEEGMASALGRRGEGESVHAFYKRTVMEREKRGEEIYSIRRVPGVPVLGATIWTFDRSGELRQECAAITGGLITGVQLDEDSKISFVCDRIRVLGGKAFLAGRGGIFGLPADKLYRDPFLGTLRNPVTGTLVKAAGEKVRVLLADAPVPLEEKPARSPDCVGPAWVEGAEWLYAGASPISSAGCTCPTMRQHTDWYKRTFVPEAYRHSIGVLDANGNLIMHLGKYGNFDSGDGAKSKMPVGGDNIAITFNRFVSGTDNYLVFDDHAERLVVLKLNYHAEESVGIGEVMSAK